MPKGQSQIDNSPKSRGAKVKKKDIHTTNNNPNKRTGIINHQNTGKKVNGSYSNKKKAVEKIVKKKSVESIPTEDFKNHVDKIFKDTTKKVESLVDEAEKKKVLLGMYSLIYVHLIESTSSMSISRKLFNEVFYIGGVENVDAFFSKKNKFEEKLVGFERTIIKNILSKFSAGGTHGWDESDEKIKEILNEPAG